MDVDLVSLDNDRQYTLQYMRMLFKYLGIWSVVSSEATRVDRILTNILVPIILCAMLFTFLPAILNMLFGNVDASALLTLAGPLNYCALNFLKYCILLFRSDVIRRCLEHMKTDWEMIERKSDQEKMLVHSQFPRTLTLVCGASIYISGLTFNLIFPIGMNAMMEGNQTMRILVYQGHEIYMDTQRSPNYEFLLISHALCGTTLFTLMTGACNVAATFAAHVYGQIDIIETRLQNLFYLDCRPNETVRHRISFILKSHVRIIRFSGDMNKVLQEICLLEVLSSSIIICWLAYHCMTGWNDSNAVALITYLTLLLSLCFNIFTFCYIGETLTQKCAYVGLMTYMSDWHLLPSKECSYFISIVFMANRSISITAGGMIDLNMQNFGGIMKTAVVYLNFLRSIAE